MRSLVFLRKPLAAAVLVAMAGVSEAAITVYTTQASFLAAVSAPGVDSFTGLALASVASPLSRSAGTYSYTATAADGFYGVGTAANPWLSTNTASDAIRFGSFSAGVGAVGGLFFGSDIGGAFAAGSLTLVATDALGATATQTVIGGLSNFFGFVSTTSMTSLVVSAVQPAGGLLWPTVDNLTLAGNGVTTPIPEPETYALILSGLGFLSFVARRRRNGT